MKNNYQSLATEKLIILLEDCLSRAEYGLRSNKGQYAYDQIKMSIDISNEIKVRTTTNKDLCEMH